MEAIFLACGAGGPQLKRNPLGGRHEPMHNVPSLRPSRPYTRSPLLLLAYGALLSVFINIFMRTGLIWIAGSAVLAVALGTAEVIIQLRRRRASA